MKKALFISLIVLSPMAIAMGWVVYTWNLERYHGTYCYLEDVGDYQYIPRDDMLTGMVALRFVGARPIADSNGAWLLDDDGNVVTSAEVSKSEAVELAKIERTQNPRKFNKPFYRLTLRNPALYWRSFTNPYDRRFYDTSDYIKSCDIYEVLN